ncbi:membrane fusion protein Use1-domain-containing protein [Desarmillaria tabescens]|uniref:Membrane fusion protein Use1-domain-containing protein n=1 Tax=Armillaria tabescens TaxID=1929756 RepID=A0AA39K705_ARMTA|nr:membrane fusion protein Use1-domain-containing protein [Desarmillaria tabescens]KAK0455532.1 membrane fusion protein Use1-domain-containing protein [Desarmillaria tabescens]
MDRSTHSTHDEINLVRLIRRLEKSTLDPSWSNNGDDVWLKALGTLQTVKYARKLLKNVELNDYDPALKNVRRYNELRMTLDRIDTFAKDVEKRATPAQKRPEPLLPRIPIPEAPPEPSPPNTTVSLPEENEMSTSPMPLPTADSLLLSPTDPPSTTISPLPTLLPALATSKATGASPHSLQNTNALHNELSDQLAQMATQLKRNALHFSNSLSADKAVVEAAQQKIESNFDVMKKERVRLRDHRGKSGSTTCLAIMSVIVVTVLFIFMVMLIRLTR